MKPVSMHWASNKGHDWTILAGDAGVYLIKMYKLSTRKTALLSSVLRVCENILRPNVSWKELPAMFEECVRVFVQMEISLPLFLCCLVFHKLLHVFACGGYIHELSSVISTWMFPEERMMAVLKGFLHSQKNRFATLAKILTLLHSIFHYRARTQPQDFAVQSEKIRIPQLMTIDLVPAWASGQKPIEFPGKVVPSDVLSRSTRYYNYYYYYYYCMVVFYYIFTIRLLTNTNMVICSYIIVYN